MRKSRGLALFSVLAVTVFALMFIFISPMKGSRKIQSTIEIERGESVSDIASKLEKEGIIDNGKLFIMLAKISGIEKKLKSGKYLLSMNMNEYDALMKIYRGKVLLKRLVIPEGFTMYQIAGRVSSITGADSTLFIAACRDRNLLIKHGISGKNCEGYLFPETYFIADDMKPEEIADMMITRFESEFPDSVFYRNRSSFTRTEYVILASMIEKEAMVDYEKPLIAGVYYNRLAKGMLLQCCATVFYAQGRIGGKLLYKDLEFVSPYNTYRHEGLPPGPISNPGRASILAALYPEKTDFMFYVSNGDGTHTFSKTYRQHINAQHSR